MWRTKHPEPEAPWEKWFTKDTVKVDDLADHFVKTFPDSKNSKVVSRKLIEVAITIPGATDIKKGEFKTFLARFGPFDKCFHKAAYGLFQDLGPPPIPHQWFHGKQDRDGTRKKLRQDLTDGQFLVRFSDRYPSDLVLSYSKGKQNKSKIIHNGPKGYHFHGKDEKFGTVAELIANEKKNGLITPIISDFYRDATASRTYKEFIPDPVAVAAATASSSSGGSSHIYSVFKEEAVPVTGAPEKRTEPSKYTIMPELPSAPTGKASGGGSRIYTTFTPKEDSKR